MDRIVLVPLVLLLCTLFAGCTTDDGGVDGGNGDGVTYPDPRTVLIEDSGEALPNGGPVNEMWEFTVPDDEFSRVSAELRFHPRDGQSGWIFKGPYHLDPRKPTGQPNGEYSTPADESGTGSRPAWTLICSAAGDCRPDMPGTWRIGLTAGAGSDARWTFVASVTYPPLTSDPAAP